MQLLIKPSQVLPELTVEYQWQISGENGTVVERGQGSAQSLADSIQAQQKLQACLLLPGEYVLYRQVEFAAAERKHLAKTIPYSLEDEVLGDVDNLQLLMAKPADTTVQVAAVDNVLLEAVVTPLLQAGVNLEACLPEQLLTDQHEGWVFVYDRQRFVIKANEQYAVIDEQNLELALRTMTDGYAELPMAIQVLVADGSEDDEILQKIPQSIHHLVDIESCSAARLFTDNKPRSHVFNFLQGRFAQGQAWGAIWKQWRAVAILAVIAAGLQLALTIVANQQLEAKNKDLAKEIEGLHRQVFPRGQIVDPRKQLEQKLRALEGGGSGAGFMQLLSDVGKVMHAADGFEISSINYEDSKSEARFDVLVSDFQQVEAIKSGIESKGYEYQLLNSTAQGDKLRARISIKQGGSRG